MNIGRHLHMADDEFDSYQLEIGTKVEMEHTDDVDIAKEIAKDHLSEIPDYYTRLTDMEEEYESEEEFFPDDES